MSTNATTSKAVLSTENDPKRAFSSALHYSLFMVVLGVIMIVIGNALINSLSRYSDDWEQYVSFGVAIAGGLSIFVAIIYPFSKKSLVSRQILYIHDDHIEGRACYRTDNTQSFLQVYETYDKISSVSTGKNSILLNLKDGRILQCPAYNAEEVASAIRAKIV